MDLLKNMVYYLPNIMVIKDMVSQKKDMLDALWEIHPRMSIDARRIHECHVYFRWMLEVYFLVDVDGYSSAVLTNKVHIISYCTKGYCTDTSYYETTSSSLTPSASAIG